MESREIRVGGCYLSWTGSIRKVTKIRNTSWPMGKYVEAVSRKESDPLGQWPGSNGAYLELFASNSVREVPCPPDLYLATNTEEHP